MGGNGVGSIINISSGAGLVGQSWSAAYNASKAAVHLLAKSTAIQYARDGIRANSVHHGAFDTCMLAAGSEEIGDSEAFNRPMGRMATPEEIARTIVSPTSRQSCYMTGTELIIVGGELSGQWRLADTPTVCSGDWAGVTKIRSYQALVRTHRHSRAGGNPEVRRWYVRQSYVPLAYPATEVLRWLEHRNHRSIAPKRGGLSTE